MLKLNNIEMPSPKLEGVTFSKEKIWSKNTGRTVNAKMTGDIIGIKTTVRIEFPPLSPADVELVESVVSNAELPFFLFELNDGHKNISKEVYAGSPSTKLYSIVDGINHYTGYAVELIER
ncbi:MAG: hypothetical protein IJ491_03655 [Clostridia bacterium]|nr:hypothetical protein [Clostridia bacterium]